MAEVDIHRRHHGTHSTRGRAGSWRGDGGAVRGRRPGPGRHAQDLAPVPQRHDRRGRLPRPPVPALRGRHREAQQRRAEGGGLPGLVADEDQLAVLRDAQGRAGPVPGAAVVRRRRGARDQHRPNAGAGAQLRGRHRLEDGRGRPSAGQDAGRQGRAGRQLDLAGRRRRGVDVLVQAGARRRRGQPDRHLRQVHAHSSFCAAAISALHVSLCSE